MMYRAAGTWLGTLALGVMAWGCSGCSERGVPAADAALTDQTPALDRQPPPPDRRRDLYPPSDRDVPDLPPKVCGSAAPTPSPPLSIPRIGGKACGTGCRQVTFGGGPYHDYEVSGSHLVYRSVFNHVHLVDLAKDKEVRICEGNNGKSLLCLTPSVDSTRASFVYYQRSGVTYYRFFTYELATGKVTEHDCKTHATCAPHESALSPSGLLTTFSTKYGCNDAAYWVPFVGGQPGALSPWFSYAKVRYTHADGHRLTWTEVGHNVFRLVVYGTKTKKRTELSRLPKETEFDSRLDGDRMVALYKPALAPGGWYQNRLNSDIVFYQLDTGKRTMVSTHPAGQERPDISGDLVVWYDWRNNPKTMTPADGAAMVNSDIFIKDLKTGKETQVTCGKSYEIYPRVEGRKVYFQSQGNSGVAIFELDLDKWDGKCLKF